MHEAVIDIETYAQIPDWIQERWQDDNPEPAQPAPIMKDDIQPPRTWKDPAKIKAWIEDKWKSLRDEADAKYQKDLAKHREAMARLVERAALSPLTGRVVAVGLAVRDQEDGVSWDVGSFVDSGDGERVLLETVDRVLADRQVSLLISYCGRRFDFPFLAIRAMKHRLSLAKPWPIGRWSKHHIDMYDILGEGKLDDWGRLLTGEKKLGDGAAVAELVDHQRWGDLEEYCTQDVRLTAQLWDMYRLAVNWGGPESPIAIPSKESMPF